MKIKVIKSRRKTMSLSVNDDLDAVVRAPLTVSQQDIDKFVADNEKWLNEAIKRKSVQLEKYNITEEEKARLIALAGDYIPKRVQYYATLMKVSPNGVKITSARKRFGSCSSRNSLCFSYYLMQYPPEAVDYVIVHELAHITEHNHSRSFYAVVEKYMPDYKQREKLLK